MIGGEQDVFPILRLDLKSRAARLLNRRLNPDTLDVCSREPKLELVIIA